MKLAVAILLLGSLALAMAEDVVSGELRLPTAIPAG